MSVTGGPASSSRPAGAVVVSRDLKDADPRLVERFLSLKADYEKRFPPKLLLITTTYRSPTAQWDLYQIGRTTPGRIVTWKDGVYSKSLHNFLPSLALDVAVEWDTDPRPEVVKMFVEFQNVALYRPLVALARQHGLFSGGEWTHADLPHLELPKEDRQPTTPPKTEAA